MMKPQYLAIHLSRGPDNEALPSQTRRLQRAGYVFDYDYSMLHKGITQVTLTSETGRARQFYNARPTYIDRRHRCQRASNSWQPSVLSPRFPHAHPARQKKNTLWSRPSLSRLSLHTPASTSKLALGQACASAPTSRTTGRGLIAAPRIGIIPIVSQPFNRRAV